MSSRKEEEVEHCGEASNLKHFYEWFHLTRIQGDSDTVIIPNPPMELWRDQDRLSLKGPHTKITESFSQDSEEGAGSDTVRFSLFKYN